MDVATSFSAKTLVAPRRKAHSLRILARWLIAVVLITLAAVLAWSWITRPTAVLGARAERGAIADVVYATGFVEPRRPVDVSSRVTAPVTAVLADEGDHVVRGQALAVLDAEDQRETMAQLTANRINAEQDEHRALALFRQGWVTNEARDKAVAAANAARAVEAAGRARVNQFTIRSGISGVILRRDVEPGDLATSSKTLFEVGNPQDLRVTATVDERDIPLVHSGAATMMSSEAFPGQVLRGRVYEITPGGDPDQRAFRVRIQPETRTVLPVGLTLEVNILVAERLHATLVPGGAIRQNAVFVVENGRAKRLPVRTGIRGTDRTEIRSGLNAGACILLDPPPELKDGEPVSVKGC